LSNDKKQKKVLTIPTEEIIKITSHTRELFEKAVSMLEYEFCEVGLEETRYKNSHVTSLLCELAWVCNAVLLLMRKNLGEPIFKDETQNEVIVLTDTLNALKALLTSQASVLRELQRFSMTLATH